MWILLTVFYMKRLGKRITLFRNIKARRNFGVDITPLPWAGGTSIKGWCCGDGSRLNSRYLLLLGSIDEVSLSSWKRPSASPPVKFWRHGKFFVSFMQTFVDNFLCVTLISWQILLTVVTFSFQQLWWHAVGLTVIVGGGTLILILCLIHSLIAVPFYPVG